MSFLINDFVINLQKTVEGKKVTILGHDNIDVDSFISGVLLSKFLNFMGTENEFYILEEVKENDTYVIIKELFDIDMKGYQKLGETEERNLFLVDHYETVHDGKVIAIVDHHPSLKEQSCELKYVRNSCATAYMLYELMKHAEYPFSVEDIRMVIAAMLIDTVSFRSSKTIQTEANEAKKLAAEYEIDFESLEKYSMLLTKIDEMTDEEIISNGEKWYSYKRKNDVASSYLQLYDFPDKEILDHWINLLRAKLEKTNVDMLVFIIYDMKNSRTYEYQVTAGKTRIAVYAGILSRGKDIMPKIEMKFMCS